MSSLPVAKVHALYKGSYASAYAWAKVMTGAATFVEPLVDTAFTEVLTSEQIGEHSEVLLATRIAEGIQQYWREHQHISRVSLIALRKKMVDTGEIPLKTNPRVDLARECILTLPARQRTPAMVFFGYRCEISALAAALERPVATLRRELVEAEQRLYTRLNTDSDAQNISPRISHRPEQERADYPLPTRPEVNALFDDVHVSRQLPVPPPTEAQWESIVQTARTAQGNPHLLLWAGIAVAVFISLLSIRLWGLGIPNRQVTSGVNILKPMQSPTAGPERDMPVSVFPKTRDIPSRFRPLDVQTVTPGIWFALGTAPCENQSCTMLASTTDAGKNWKIRHIFPPAESASDIPKSQLTSDNSPSSSVSLPAQKLLFLDEKHGFVYGKKLWVTRDGGTTFHAFDHQEEQIIDLAVHRQEVIALTAASCHQRTCTSPIKLFRVPAKSQEFSTPIAQAKEPESLKDAYLYSGSVGLVLIPGTPQELFTSNMILRGDILAEIHPEGYCRLGPWAIADSPIIGAPTAMALCSSSTHNTSHANLYVTKTANSGHTYTAVSRQPLPLPAGSLDLLWLNQNTVLAASYLPANTASSSTSSRLLQSQNGGISWEVPVNLPAELRYELKTIRRSDTGMLLAITSKAQHLWVSRNNGSTWETLPIQN